MAGMALAIPIMKVVWQDVCFAIPIIENYQKKVTTRNRVVGWNFVTSPKKGE